MNPRPKLLAVASGGGHWVELMRLRPAFAEFETSYVSMFENYSKQLDGAKLYIIPDCTRFNPYVLIPIFWKALRIIKRERPVAIITTGSAPALPFIFIGRFYGCRTLWIDSIANSESLTMSGSIARKFADKVICQWPDVAEREKVECWGAVI
jgi:UDP-N-acetylglucosamine:LPS N-acetylglucosamine transferase